MGAGEARTPDAVAANGVGGGGVTSFAGVGTTGDTVSGGTAGLTAWASLRGRPGALLTDGVGGGGFATAGVGGAGGDASVGLAGLTARAGLGSDPRTILAGLEVLTEAAFGAGRA